MSTRPSGHPRVSGRENHTQMKRDRIRTVGATVRHVTFQLKNIRMDVMNELELGINGQKLNDMLLNEFPVVHVVGKIL
jgi:hypothetical protein